MQSVGPFNAKRPFTRATARAAGISASRVVSGQYQKIFWDQYVSADMKLTNKLRAASALGIVPPGSHLSHYTAAALWGAVVPPDPDTHVWLSSPNGRLVREGLKCHYGNGRPQVTTLEGMLISTPEQSFLDLASVGVGLVDLVVAADSLIKVRSTTPEALLDAAARYGGRHKRTARRAATMARAGVDSAQETRLRLLIVMAGLPEPKVNVIRRDAEGDWLRRYDLTYDEYRLAVEYDGRQHAEDNRQWQTDIARREELDRRGWRLVVVTADGIYREPLRTLERVGEALRDCGAKGLPKRFKPEWERYSYTR
jgi:very-short-patch-repair endonuclease